MVLGHILISPSVLIQLQVRPKLASEEIIYSPAVTGHGSSRARAVLRDDEHAHRQPADDRKRQAAVRLIVNPESWNRGGLILLGIRGS